MIDKEAMINPLDIDFDAKNGVNQGQYDN